MAESYDTHKKSYLVIPLFPKLIEFSEVLIHENSSLIHLLENKFYYDLLNRHLFIPLFVRDFPFNFAYAFLNVY